MHIHEFGDSSNPVILLLPGTMCYWKGNFGGVIENLSHDFLVACVAYTGFDECDTQSYGSVTDELNKVEDYITKHYGGTIHAAYGCSLGGTFVAQLVARHHVHMKYGIIGSSDLDQAGDFKAGLMASLMVRVTYNFIHTGHYQSKFMQKRYHERGRRRKFQSVYIRIALYHQPVIHHFSEYFPSQTRCFLIHNRCFLPYLFLYRCRFSD